MALREPGIPVSYELSHLVAHTGTLCSILQARDNSQRASDAAAESMHAFEHSRNNASLGAVACQAGCAHCCRSSSVWATAPELFWLARQVRKLTPEGEDALMNRLFDYLDVTGGRDLDTRFDINADCPLLLDDQCTQYRHRPLVCRALASRSVDDCVRVLVHKQPGGIRMPMGGLHLRTAHAGTLRAALRLSGYIDDRYELAAGLLTVLADDQSEQRWLAKELVFAALEDTSVATESDVDETVDRIVMAMSGQSA